VTQFGPGQREPRVPLVWNEAARKQIPGQLRQALGSRTRLLDIVEAGAEFLHTAFGARGVMVARLDGDVYRDLVNVGELPPGEDRFPTGGTYSDREYPLATRLLRDSGGYIASTPGDDLFEELLVALPSTVGSVIGVSIVSAGTARGEICMTRSKEQPAFTAQDFDVLRDLATIFGSRMVGALDR
jgi:GAF domain-containing protein